MLGLHNAWRDRLPQMSRSGYLSIIVILACAFTFGYHFGSGRVGAQTTSLWNGRLYFLTKKLVTGNAAIQACPTGFHFASRYEMEDHGNHKYDPARGVTNADSGYGPPSVFGSGTFYKLG